MAHITLTQRSMQLPTGATIEAEVVRVYGSWAQYEHAIRVPVLEQTVVPALVPRNPPLTLHNSTIHHMHEEGVVRDTTATAPALSTGVTTHLSPMYLTPKDHTAPSGGRAPSTTSHSPDLPTSPEPTALEYVSTSPSSPTTTPLATRSDLQHLEGLHELSPLLGTWFTVEHCIQLQQTFSKNANAPFPHVVIPNFFEAAFAQTLQHKFPPLPVYPQEPHSTLACNADGSPSEVWQLYNNPLEVKYCCNDLAKLPAEYAQILALLNSEAFVRVLAFLSGIVDLEADPCMHGAGLHAYPTAGKLDMHLDYSIHPLLEPLRERRLNLIVYLTPDWQDCYGGALQLWDKDLTHLVKQIPAQFNSAVLFQTSDLSYHGVPTPITCPPGEARRSLTAYYVAPVRVGVTPRYKATFYKTPLDPPDAVCEYLRQIRGHRRIQYTDVLVAQALQHYNSARSTGQVPE